MVNMIIDGKQISAEENITIMEAAERNGIPIPEALLLKRDQRDRGLQSLRRGAGRKREADHILQQCCEGRHGDLHQQPEGQKS